MNDRIRELAGQAGEYTNSVYQPPVRSKTPGKIWEDGHVGWHEIFNQKFAELIIQECVTKMALEVMNNSWVDDAVKNTYEHFGVE